MNYVPEGILYDDSLRGTIKPIDHCLRDPMHTLVSGGVAGTEVAALVHVLAEHGITHEHLRNYIRVWTLPKCLGKVDSSCLEPGRVLEDQIRAFASDILDLLPLLLSFLEDAVAPRDICGDNIRCFKLLVRIVEICTRGPRRAAMCVEELRQTIVDHHTLFKKLYPAHIKPKFHQLMHIPENISHMGLLLSCFVTERKHRSVKRSALWTFRNFEYTVVSDMLNRFLVQVEKENVYSHIALTSARGVLGPEFDVDTSVVMRLYCGEVRRGDVIVAKGKVVFSVAKFWRVGETFAVQGTAHHATDNARVWQSSGRLSLVHANDIVCAVTWASAGDGRFRVILPPSGLGF